ncbi:MAG: right-handed parallel beta-helix repeat-containing protein, partial [Thaumarchaeota archaeon]|nr:right-handed parallel beta-helix repeat-containing protein [Nitrososphaerota archaeon]
GYSLENITNSTIRLDFAGANLNDGLSITNSSGNIITQNEFVLNGNGLSVSGGKGDQITKNNATLNAFSGILLLGSTQENIASNIAANDSLAIASGSQSCGDLSCAVAGGISLVNSTDNSISRNVAQNNTGAAGLVGYGIVLAQGSNYNYVFQNNATDNEAGLGFSNSFSNLVTRNFVQYNKYGLYYTNGVNNVVEANTVTLNLQEIYPDQPSVSFTSPIGNSPLDGMISISWKASGQSIVNQTITIDGNSTTVDGSSYSWNSAPLPDGPHAVTIQVENSGGFSASATVEIFTDNQLINNRTITVNLIGPGGIPLGNTNVRLSNSTLTLNGSTDSSGAVSFHELHIGTYIASYGVNASAYSATISLSRDSGANPTIVLFVPVISTTFDASLPNGSSVSLAMKGNVSSEALNGVTMIRGNGQYSLSFTVSISNESAGSSTITIPKSIVPAGLVPSVTLDGKTQNQAYTQDQNNYYVTFYSPQGTHGIVISFRAPQLLQAEYIIVIVAVLAVLLIGAVIAARRRKRPPFMR